MPAIKITDREPRAERRKPRLWETFGGVGVNPTEIKAGKGVFFAIVRQNQIEELITDKVKQTFLNNGFEITVPIEYDSMRSIIIKHMDKVVDEYTNDEIKESIQRTNEWAEVIEIFRIPTTGRLLKVKFASTCMAQYAIDNRMIVPYQRINPKHIEKEVFVHLTPCYNCFQYNHKTSECPTEKQTLCSYCADSGHRHNKCTKSEPKCINCGGKHCTLAAACKTRRALNKEKGKEIRKRSRSRSQNRVTYAQATTHNRTQQEVNIENTQETKQPITTIITSIAFSHYMEALNPGTFQNNMDEMFRLNDIPPMKFPKEIVTHNIIEIYRDTLRDSTATAEKDQATPQTRPQRERETEQAYSAMDVETAKRSRESNEFSEIKEKRKKEENKTEKDDSKQTSSYTLPQPLSTRSLPTSPDKGRELRTERRASLPGRDSKEQTSTKAKLDVKEIGLVAFFKKSFRYIIDTQNQERREILRDVIFRGEARIQWRHPQVTYEAIHNGIAQRVIRMKDIAITRLPD